MSRRERRLQEEREAKEQKKLAKLARKENRKRKKNIEYELVIENTDCENKEQTVEIAKYRKEEKTPNIVWKIAKGFLKALLVIILALILILACFIGWLGFKYDWNPKKMVKGGAKEVALMITGQTEKDVANLDPIYCLVMGVSTDEGLLLTDTLIVCAYYPRTQQASMMSIPRDTFVGKSEATATSGEKINAVYANYNGGKRGAEKLLEYVEKITGLEINNYVVVKNEGLIKIVDEIGGVQFDVPINMDYEDPGQDLYIHLKAGMQTIDGPKAEQLLRFRHNSNGTSYPESYGGEDLGRTQTQRNFITETIRQTLQFKNVTKINNLINIAFDNIETNMDIDYVLKYSPAAVEFNADLIQNAYLPGSPVMYNKWAFYKVNKAETQKIVNELFTFKQKVSDASQGEETPLNPEYITLQVYDGTGDKQTFENTIQRLKDKGYNIKNTELTTVTKTTKVINRTNKNIETIDELIDTLGYGEETKGKINPDYDITIIIGQDMLQYNVTMP